MQLLRAIAKDNASQQVQVQVHVIWHAPGTSKAAPTVATPAPMLGTLAFTGHSFVGHWLDSERFLAVETHGAIFADCPRLDELAPGTVVMTDRGGALRARMLGAEECIVVGRHCQLDAEQPCAYYLLDIRAMWNADGKWGLVLHGANHAVAAEHSPGLPGDTHCGLQVLRMLFSRFTCASWRGRRQATCAAHAPHAK